MESRRDVKRGKIDWLSRERERDYGNYSLTPYSLSNPFELNLLRGPDCGHGRDERWCSDPISSPPCPTPKTQTSWRREGYHWSVPPSCSTRGKWQAPEMGWERERKEAKEEGSGKMLIALLILKIPWESFHHHYSVRIPNALTSSLNLRWRITLTGSLSHFCSLSLSELDGYHKRWKW